MHSVVLIVAADHPWRLDLSSLAAILAAAGTGALAIFTWRLAVQTRTLAAATGEDVRAEWRPVLIMAGSEPFVVGMQGQAQVAEARLRLVNVGRGPALNVLSQIESRSSTESKAGPLTLAGTLETGVTLPIAAQGMLYRDSSGGPEPSLSYTVAVSYEDLSGRSHTTEMVFDDPAHGNHRILPTQNSTETFTLEVTSTKVSQPDVTAK